MPIYAYRCEACGFAKDVLQKMSDPQLTVCLSCGAPRFKKQLTAAGFQLKGTGWYATDFRNGSGASAAPVAPQQEGGSDTRPDGADKPGGDKSAPVTATPAGTSAASSPGAGTTASAAPATQSGSTAPAP